MELNGMELIKDKLTHASLCGAAPSCRQQQAWH